MSGPSFSDVKLGIEALRGWTVERLSEMVRCESLQGNEAGVQDVAQRIMQEELGMKVDRWALDIGILKTHRGFR
jgi:hypothetical protein